MVSILRCFRALVIAEVGSAAAFAADHAGTNGVFRRAHLAEQRALVRRHAGAQHVAAAASLRFDGGLSRINRKILYKSRHSEKFFFPNAGFI